MDIRLSGCPLTQHRATDLKPPASIDSALSLLPCAPSAQAVSFAVAPPAPRRDPPAPPAAYTPPPPSYPHAKHQGKNTHGHWSVRVPLPQHRATDQARSFTDIRPSGCRSQHCAMDPRAPIHLAHRPAPRQDQSGTSEVQVPLPSTAWQTSSTSHSMYTAASMLPTRPAPRQDQSRT